MSPTNTTLLSLAVVLSVFGCERQTSSDRVGPYSLHCSEQGAPPTCIRFHASTGSVRRLELERIAHGKADPDSSTAGSVYTLTCRNFGLAHGAPGQAAIQCLRLDTHTGEVIVVDATSAPPAL